MRLNSLRFRRGGRGVPGRLQHGFFFRKSETDDILLRSGGMKRDRSPGVDDRTDGTTPIQRIAGYGADHNLQPGARSQL